MNILKIGIIFSCLLVSALFTAGCPSSETPTQPTTPVPTRTPTNSPTITETPTPSNTATISPTNTPSSTATNTPSSTPTATPTSTYTACPSGTNFGNSGINNSGAVVAGYTVAGRYACTASQTLTHVKIRGGGNIGNQNLVGIYYDGSGGTAPSTRATFAAYYDDAYATTIDVPIGPVALLSGSSYWLAITSNTSGQCYYSYTVSASGSIVLFAGTMPFSYPGSNLTTQTNLLSVFAYLCP